MPFGGPGSDRVRWLPQVGDKQGKGGPLAVPLRLHYAAFGKSLFILKRSQLALLFRQQIVLRKSWSRFEWKWTTKKLFPHHCVDTCDLPMSHCNFGSISLSLSLCNQSNSHKNEFFQPPAIVPKSRISSLDHRESGVGSYSRR